MIDKQVPINHITRHGDAQSRAAMNQAVIRDYVEAMTDGAEFPPVTLFADGETLWMADGFHRLQAAKEAGLTEIAADVREGTLRDAILFSVSANNTHGLRRTNEDKMRSVLTLLQDEVWRTWSDRLIAARCGVSQPFVSGLRYKSSGDNGFQQERVGADGKTHKVKHWGENGGHYSFWEQVRKFGLDEETVLEQIQPGAATVMDLKLSKQDTWRRLDQLATDAIAEIFPPDSYVKHPTGRFGRVLQCHPTSIRVFDYETDADNSWQLSGVQIAALAEFGAWRAQRQMAKQEAERARELAEQAANVQAALPEASDTGLTSEQWRESEHELMEAAADDMAVEKAATFALDDKVTIEGSNVVGTITDIGGVYRGHEGQVCVTRPNPNGGSNMTHWVSVLKVKKVDYIPDTPKTTPEVVGEGVAENAQVESQSTPALQIGDTVRNKRNGQTGEIVGFQGDAAFVEGVNGKRLVGRDFLERVDEPGGQADAPLEQSVEVPTENEVATLGKSDEQIEAEKRLEERQQRAATKTPAEKVQEWGKKPWVVNTSGAYIFVEDADGNVITRALSFHEKTKGLADEIVTAVNAHRDYKNKALLAVLPALHRILDYADRGSADMLSQADFASFTDWLTDIESLFWDEPETADEETVAE